MIQRHLHLSSSQMVMSRVKVVTVIDTTSIETELEEETVPVLPRREKRKKSFGEEFTTFSEVERDGGLTNSTVAREDTLQSIENRVTNTRDTSHVYYPAPPKKFQKDTQSPQNLSDSQRETPRSSVKSVAKAQTCPENSAGTPVTCSESEFDQSPVGTQTRKDHIYSSGGTSSHKRIATPVQNQSRQSNRRLFKVLHKDKTPSHSSTLKHIKNPEASHTEDYQLSSEQGKGAGKGKTPARKPIGTSIATVHSVDPKSGADTEKLRRVKECTSGSGPTDGGMKTSMSLSVSEEGRSALASTNMTNRILFELVKLTGEVRQLRRVVERQSENRRAPTSAQDFIPELVDGPVTSIKDSRALLKSCAQKPQQDFLFNLLIGSSGDNMKSSVKIVMSRLFNNYAMSFINLDGRGQNEGGQDRKLAMRNTPLCRVVTDVVVSQHPHESVSAIHAAISNYLKMAPFRDGGAGKGAQLPQDDCEDECDDDDLVDIRSQKEDTESACPDDLHDMESDSSHSIQ